MTRDARIQWVKLRSTAFVTYRDWRYAGIQFALRKLVGWRFGRF